MSKNGEPRRALGRESIDAVKTWRCLRLAMVALVVGLGVSVGVEHFKVHSRCFQTSISAYYYTPVRGYFVGALIGIAVCLVCLRGSTPIEDMLLNFAGMFAPVVALVPTPNPGTCTSLKASTHGRDANVANNVTALLAVGAAVLLITAIRRRKHRPNRLSLIAWGIAAAVWLGATLAFFLARHFFVDHAHYTAAVLMFICLVVAVSSNALGYRADATGRSLRNRYAVIAFAMGGSMLVMIVIGLLGWSYWILVIEMLLITLFAMFWIIQTKELWDVGLRPSGLRLRADAS